MIIFNAEGRLGNQVFQILASIELFKSKEWKIFLGYKESKRFLDLKVLERSIFVPRSIEKILLKLKLTLQFFNIKLTIPFVAWSEMNDLRLESIPLESKNKRVLWVYNSFFQNEKFLPKKPQVCINESLLDKASNMLNSIRQKSQVDVYFLHVRRGDYIKWPDPSSPAVLPLSYYHKAINKISFSSSKEAIFLCSGDDYFYMQNHFNDSKKFFLINESPELTMALFSCCDGGILSASSFSWISAYFLTRRNPSALCLAPKYWIGHHSQEWFPDDIETSFLSYIEV